MVLNIKLLNTLLLLLFDMKRIFSCLLVFLLFSSCEKDDQELNFKIKLNSVSPTNVIEFEENIIVSINYEHQKGFVGFADPDYLSLEVKDSRLENSDLYHLIPINPPNESLSVKGEIQIEIDAPFVFGNGFSETLNYSIRIQDKDSVWSNIIVTPIITVNK